MPAFIDDTTFSRSIPKSPLRAVQPASDALEAEVLSYAQAVQRMYRQRPMIAPTLKAFDILNGRMALAADRHTR